MAFTVHPCFLPQVLFKFLVEFSEFDWEHYCLSIQGPIPVISFPDYRGECKGRASQP